MGTNPIAVAEADYNADGKPDLAVTNKTTPPGFVAAFVKHHARGREPADSRPSPQSAPAASPSP